MEWKGKLKLFPEEPVWFQNFLHPNKHSAVYHELCDIPSICQGVNFMVYLYYGNDRKLILYQTYINDWHKEDAYEGRKRSFGEPSNIS